MINDQGILSPLRLPIAPREHRSRYCIGYQRSSGSSYRGVWRGVCRLVSICDGSSARESPEPDR